MNITLVTSFKHSEEHDRLRSEAVKEGHVLKIANVSGFEFVAAKEGLIVPLLKGQKPDIVLVRGIFNSIKAISLVVGDLKKQGVKVFDNNLSSHKYAIDKVTDLIKLALNKIPVPETYHARSFARLRQIGKQLDYPRVVKSARSGKGNGVFKVGSGEEYEQLLDELEQSGKSAKSYLVQEYIPYDFDLRCLIIGDKMLTMRRIPGEGEFRANFSLGGSVELFEPSEKIRELALKSLRAIGMPVGGVDILLAGAKMYVLEVNHTPGFVGMEQATGENIAKIYLDYAVKNAK